MKRKVIRQGHNTLTITLPSKWAQEHNIIAGHELDFSIENNNLVFHPQNHNIDMHATLEIGKEKLLLDREISALSKKGYDSITIRYEDPALITEIQSMMNSSMVGFEIVNQREGSCELRCIAKAEIEEFDKIMSRILIQLQVMSEGINEAMKTGNLSTLPGFQLMEKNNNRYTGFLRRLLNKGMHPDKKNDKILYTIIEFLEKIADEYKYMCLFLQEEKTGNKKISPKVLEIYKNLDICIKYLIKMYYKIDKPTLYNHFRIRKKIVKDCHELMMMQSISKKETVLCHYALSIIQEVADVWSLILTKEM